MSIENIILNFCYLNKEFLRISISPTYILIRSNISSDFIVIHFNKYLIKDHMVTHSIFKGEYDYVKLFFKLNEIITYNYFGDLVDKKVINFMKTEQRDQFINLLLTDDK